MNTLIEEELNEIPYCTCCGFSFETQKDIDTLIYSRTTASEDYYICPDCKEESIRISLK